MSLITIVSLVILLAIVSHIIRTKMSHRGSTNVNVIEVLPATRVVEVEILDEMTKEKVRNLYEEQDVCNARISYLLRQNKQYEYELSKIEDKIRENLEEVRIQAKLHPHTDARILKASYETSNQNLYKHSLKYEGLILANQEKIISCKKKSNAISEQITKIGKEVYARQMR